MAAADPRAQLRRLARRLCIPINVTFELTLHCNLRCRHCYNFDRAAPEPEHRALSETEIHDAIDQVRAAGCLNLAFTGGEALAHPALDAFIAHAQRCRLAVAVKTNGALLSPGRARRLAEAGCGSAEVSVYGGTAETHDRFTRVAGSFVRTVRGIEAARAEGLAVKLSFPLVQSNAAEVEEMMALAERLEVRVTFDPQITARVDGTTDPMDLRLDRPALERVYRGPLRDMRPSPCFDERRSVQCNCARSVCGIGSSGDVYPCIGAPMPAGNLREQSFAKIWKDAPVLNRIRNLSLDDFAVCKPCPDRPYCRRSSGVVYANTRAYTGAEPWTCMEASVIHALHDELGAPAQKTVLRRHSFD